MTDVTQPKISVAEAFKLDENGRLILQPTETLKPEPEKAKPKRTPRRATARTKTDEDVEALARYESEGGSV